MGTGIKGRKKDKKMEVEKIVLHNTTVKIPQDSGPGEEREIEKTPLCHPLLLQAEINEEGRRRRRWRKRRTKMKVGAR